MTIHNQTRIVIAGAGFGGVHAYLGLQKVFSKHGNVSIKLINPTDHFTFTPMIHEVATGNLSPASITQPLRTLPGCCSDMIIEGYVRKVSCVERAVSVRYTNLEASNDSGDRMTPTDVQVPYDYLVLALGSETNFFTVPGAHEYAYELKSLDDAMRLKNTLIEQFQKAARLEDPHAQKDALRFVVVGDGPTGVELAGEIADLVNGELHNAFPTLHHRAEVVLIGRGDRLMARLDTWFGDRAEHLLHHKGSVRIMHGTSVTEVTSEGVETSGGAIASGITIWAAGVKAREVELITQSHAPLDDRSKRVKVNEYLHLPEHDNIFVVGDQAWIPQQGSEMPYPMRAQFAVREGETAAHNIAARINRTPMKPFHFEEKGMIISLGKGGSLAQAYGMRFSGPFGWFVYRTAYLLSLVGLRAKFRTALEWTLNLFLPRDISKL